MIYNTRSFKESSSSYFDLIFKSALNADTVNSLSVSYVQ